ncbi:MAG: hypothetical protein KGL39_31565 [Patescibacteria group bacterium]|nr:hypothetical protein [Patescibacteria group bacterium]
MDRDSEYERWLDERFRELVREGQQPSSPLAAKVAEVRERMDARKEASVLPLAQER